MNQYALKLKKKVRIIGGIITLIAGYDYFLDIRKVDGVFDIKGEYKSPQWAISRKVQFSSILFATKATDFKDKMVLMIHPTSQEYILTRVELIEQEELKDQNDSYMFQMILPQGTFYGRISENALKFNDSRNIQSQSQIIGIPFLLL